MSPPSPNLNVKNEVKDVSRKVPRINNLQNRQLLFPATQQPFMLCLQFIWIPLSSSILDTSGKFILPGLPNPFDVCSYTLQAWFNDDYRPGSCTFCIPKYTKPCLLWQYYYCDTLGFSLRLFIHWSLLRIVGRMWSWLLSDAARWDWVTDDSPPPCRRHAEHAIPIECLILTYGSEGRKIAVST